MSVEVVLFLIVGTVSVLAAVGMLGSQNAVYSALFLIVNFICVAFLYLLLDAAFLALVQIAVYAGAIMVLFLFVIMLLGAEKLTGGGTRQFHWLPISVMGLAAVLLLVLTWALTEGDIDDKEIAAQAPMVRVAHLAPDVDEADFYLNGELFAEGLSFTGRSDDDPAYSDFESVEPGEYEVSVVTGDDPEPLPLGSFTAEAGQTLTVAVYGERLPRLAVLDQDLSQIDGREARLTLFNAFAAAGTVNLVESGRDFLFRDEVDALEAPTLIDGLEPGETSETIMVEEGEPGWAIVSAELTDASAVAADAEGEGEEPESEEATAPEAIWANTNDVVLYLRDYEVERGTSTVLVLAAERDPSDGKLYPVQVPLMAKAAASFGSPKSIGEELFIKYMLPFEMVALLLLVAMVGAIVLTQRSGIKPKPGRPTRRKVSRPLTSVIASQTGHPVTQDDVPLLEEQAGEAVEQPEPAGD